MIVGHGDIASVLTTRDRRDRIYFASGVSNSQETRESEYDREKILLLKQDRSKHLIYFGSLSIFYSQSRYAMHKREMECLIKLNFPKHTIVRMGNITWGDNPHTLINYLRDKIEHGETFEIKDEYRFILDKEEFLYWIDMIPDFSCEMNIVGKRMKVVDVVREYIRLGISKTYWETEWLNYLS